MIRQLAEERPGVQPGPAGWFLRGGTCRQAGLIIHRLVFGVLVELSALKNQPKAIAYTDLLPAVFILGYFYCLVQQFYIEVDFCI